jgi:HEPN domain-containing protein
MTRKRLPANDPHEWLHRARSNLACARTPVPEADLEDLCFDALQAAEKAVKAVFIRCGEHFPFTHDLEELLTLLGQIGLKIPKYLWEADDLTPFAAETRYPGRAAPVTRRQYNRAVRIAAAVLRWAERQVAAGEKKPRGKK